jgi:hypothetical protein
MITSRSRAEIMAIVSDRLNLKLPEVQIYRAREWPLQLREMPALLVYAWDETKTGPAMASEETAYSVSCILTVDLKVTDRARDGVEVEADLEALASRIYDAILRSRPLLTGPDGIERIADVRTTLGVSLQNTERSIGEGRIAFDMRWTEIYALDEAEIACDEPFVTLNLIPPLPAS